MIWELEGLEAVQSIFWAAKYIALISTFQSNSAQSATAGAVISKPANNSSIADSRKSLAPVKTMNRINDGSHVSKTLRKTPRLLQMKEARMVWLSLVLLVLYWKSAEWEHRYQP
jgi:hypothetical protein